MIQCEVANVPFGSDMSESTTSTDDFAAAIRMLTTDDLVRTAAELNQQSLVLITHLMMIADEIARREPNRPKMPTDC